jgi:hypothetical protein
VFIEDEFCRRFKVFLLSGTSAMHESGFALDGNGVRIAGFDSNGRTSGDVQGMIAGSK